MTARTLLLPASRVERWCANVGVRHGEAVLSVHEGALRLEAPDGAVATLRLPWDRAYAGPADPVVFAEAVTVPVPWAVLLVRRGGFAVARGTTPVPEATKVGKRHVQGTTKAGGWSQQRYARRRDNQARAAFDAAGETALRVLVTEANMAPEALVCGGDRPAVDAVLADPRLRTLAAVRTSRWLALPDPSAAVLAQAVEQAWSVEAHIDEPAA